MLNWEKKRPLRDIAFGQNWDTQMKVGINVLSGNGDNTTSNTGIDTLAKVVVGGKLSLICKCIILNISAGSGP